MSDSSLLRVTVCGAGVQGSMIAFRCAIWGKEVALYDVDRQAALRAMGKIHAWLRDFVTSERLTEAEAQAAWRRVAACDDLATAVAAADIVIENVPEPVSYTHLTLPTTPYV